jgi:hypothetical protein
VRIVEFTAYRGGPRYTDFKEAIVAAVNNPRNRRAESEIARVRGAVVTGCAWTDSDYVLALDNGLFVYVYLRGAREGMPVEWKIVEQMPKLQEALGSDCEADTIEYRGQRITRVDRAAIMRARIGASIRTLFANQHGFYVYTDGQLTLCFEPCYLQGTGEDFICLFEDD